MPEVKSIALSELIVDVVNPRFDTIQANQRDAIRAVVSNNSKKTLSLCKDIVENKLNPSENLIVILHPKEKGL